jgi:hypothetical protein
VARTTTLVTVLGLAVLALSAGFARAADWPAIGDGPRWPSIPQARQPWPNFALPRPPAAYDGEFGLRYWFSWGSTAKDLYNTTGSTLVSRLTYDDLRSHSGELFGRTDFTTGWYVKGYGGLGFSPDGTLNDEDFPPVVSPYSSTLSDQKQGHLAYLTLDGGFNVVRSAALRLGVFAGYHYLDQKVSAFGCQQVASNNAICGGTGVAGTTLVITQNNRWHGLRVGLDTEVKLSERLRLTADAAYLPYVRLRGMDFHWLRIGADPGDFTGGIPEDGKGHGFQIEGALAYDVSKQLSVAIGGRYWHLETTGNTHFEGHVVGQTAFPQPVNWKADNIGVFVQGTFRFGPYPTGSGF